jgi:hypothetical protein
VTARPKNVGVPVDSKHSSHSWESVTPAGWLAGFSPLEKEEPEASDSSLGLTASEARNAKNVPARLGSGGPGGSERAEGPPGLGGRGLAEVPAGKVWPLAVPNRLITL